MLGGVSGEWLSAVGYRQSVNRLAVANVRNRHPFLLLKADG